MSYRYKIDFDVKDFQKHNVYVFDVFAELFVLEWKCGLYLTCEIKGKFNSKNNHGYIQFNDKIIYDKDMSFEQTTLLNSVFELNPNTNTAKNAIKSLFYSTCGDLIKLYNPTQFDFLVKNGCVVGTIGETPSEKIILTTNKTFKNWEEING